MKFGVEDIQVKMNSLKKSKQEKEQAKQQLDLDINQLNNQIEALKTSIQILFPFEKSKERNTKILLSKVKEERIPKVVSFMKSRGGKNIHAKEIAEYLKKSRVAIRNWMVRVAQKPTSPWICTKDQSTYSLKL